MVLGHPWTPTLCRTLASSRCRAIILLNPGGWDSLGWRVRSGLKSLFGPLMTLRGFRSLNCGLGYLGLGGFTMTLSGFGSLWLRISGFRAWGFRVGGLRVLRCS